MTSQTRIQLKVRPDSGSIFYQDSENGVVFHIEAKGDSPPASHSSSPTLDSIDVRQDGRPGHSTNNTDEGDHQAGGDGGHETGAAQTDLIKSFLRQHLVKNGEDSRCLIPMMHKDSIEAMLIAVVGLHLRRDGGQGKGDSTVDTAGRAVESLYKTLGRLVSLLQQREKALRYVEEDT